MLEKAARQQSQFHDSEALGALMATLQSPADRRENPRFECSYTVEFDGQRTKGICTDISLSGMRVSLVGDGFVSDLGDLRCWVWIDGSTIRLQGRIVRVTRSRQVAIRFHEAANAVARRRLNLYVAGNPAVPDRQAEFRKIVSMEERIPRRGIRHACKQESGFLVIDEEAVPHIAAYQAEKMPQADSGGGPEEAAQVADPRPARPFVSTMSRNRGVSLMKFWIDRRSSHHSSDEE